MIDPVDRIPSERGHEAAPPLSPHLKRDAPLVPIDSAAGRSLMAVIAILTFLAALCAGGAALVANASTQWRSSIAREVTIQIRPSAGRDGDALVAQAAEIARMSPGVAGVEPYTREQSARLLEPWIGSGAGLLDLPIPRIVAVTLAEDARADTEALRRRIVAEVPGATLDDHALWLRRLSSMANTVVGVGIGLVLLVLLATGLAVAFATRGAMAGNKEIVDVLHLVGGDDAFIAREFQIRFLRLGLKGGALGCAAALAFIALAGLAAGSLRASPAGDQIEALFGAFDMGLGDYVLILLVGLVVAAVTAVVSRVTVRRYLADLR
ncbi:cell division protein FtsX [Salinarimonas soli]|uniref:ABC transporter permease n=1 Tax=Salinarimonas soli TaxID=1638099 RepID=A0A5B2VAK0_9HYPH|nr:ABC transporter permease [Salinarimonas soli]KAA2236014.1 ABC transporter permease [Salinarimonas soli]